MRSSYRRLPCLPLLLSLVLVGGLAAASGCGGGSGENQVGVSETGMTDEEMEAYSAEADALNEE